MLLENLASLIINQLDNQEKESLTADDVSGTWLFTRILDSWRVTDNPDHRLSRIETVITLKRSRDSDNVEISGKRITYHQFAQESFDFESDKPMSDHYPNPYANLTNQETPLSNKDLGPLISLLFFVAQNAS